MNLSSVGNLNFVPTRSKVCEKLPISITIGYIMDSVNRDAKSYIAARS